MRRWIARYPEPPVPHAFTPTPPAFSPPQSGNLKLWLKADTGVFSDTALTTPQLLNGGAVGGWQDQSGNGNHATQATNSQQPTLQYNAVGGRPTIQFAFAASQFLACNSAAAAWAGTNVPMTLIVVIKLADLTSGNAAYFGLGAAALALWRFGVKSTTLQYQNIKRNDAGANNAQGGGVINTSPHAVTQINPGTTWSLNVDGTAVIGPVAQNSGATTFAACNIGAIDDNGTIANFWSGFISEVMAWNVGLSAADQTTVRTYLESKYRIPGT
jgi:hypothetical protein